MVRVLQRIFALTAAIWHNDKQERSSERQRGQGVPTDTWMVAVLLPARTSSGTQAGLSRENPPGNASHWLEPEGGGQAGMCKVVVHSAAWLPHAMDTSVAQPGSTVKLAARPAWTRSPVLAKRRCGSLPPVPLTCSTDVVSRLTTPSVPLRGWAGDRTTSIGLSQAKLTTPGGVPDLDAADASPVGGATGVGFAVHAAVQQRAATTAAPMTVRMVHFLRRHQHAHEPIA
jgi:hypothetical protein